jgi:hypothetical protein
MGGGGVAGQQAIEEASMDVNQFSDRIKNAFNQMET